MPNRDAKLFEVLIPQIAEDRQVDIVLGELLSVLGHAELFEPLRNRHAASRPRLVLVYERELAIGAGLSRPRVMLRSLAERASPALPRCKNRGFLGVPLIYQKPLAVTITSHNSRTGPSFLPYHTHSAPAHRQNDGEITH